MRDTDPTPRPQDIDETHSTPPVISFAELGLRPDVIRAINDMGFSAPMPVQASTIPAARAGKDLLVQSRTGSGKTAAFAIPFVDWIASPGEPFVQALVLLPTRELALQVAAETARISANSGLSVVPVYGGAPMGRQVEQLKAGGQIVCGTPGRTLDHLRRGTLDLSRVKCVVLDECDEMLSMGFQEDIENILESTPESRQTLLFSATIPEGIQRLSRRFLKNPEILKLSADFVGVHEIQHAYYSIPGGNREADLVRILDFESPERAVIFCNTRDETTRVSEHLRRIGLDADAISSNLSQNEREGVMQRMRAGKIRFLVATDVAARGIDIENLPCVINYSFPESPEIYIHRTGRTGRAGKSGRAVSLIGPTEVGSFYYLKLLYKIRPEERSLPSEIEIKTRREGEKIAMLRALVAKEPEQDWIRLARRLIASVDGERLVAFLLKDRLANKALPTVTLPPKAEEESVRPAPTALPSTPVPPTSFSTSTNASSRSFPAKDRPSRRSDSSTERFPRDGQRSDRPRREGAPPKAVHPPRSSEEEKEFWEVWSEEAGRTPSPEETRSPSEINGTDKLLPKVVPTGNVVRLYVNLGKKDGVTSEAVANHLSSFGFPISASAIELMNTHCYVNVASEVSESLCTQASNTTLAGRAVLCEPARPPRRR